MAGTFTHFTICKEGLSRQAVLGSDLRQFLNKYSQFVYLGAVSPDLAYLSFKTGHTNWADVMHYEKTNSIVISGFEELRTAGLMRAPVEVVKLAWLLGYASHLVTDATIHPVVNATVGDYAHHQTEHRVCEMTQDSLIFYETYSSDIAYAEFSQILEYCRDSDAFEPLMEFWKSQLLQNYPEKGEEPHPSVWFKTYADEAIDAAEGGSKLVGLFRHLGLAKTYLYHTKAEIEANYPADKHDFYDAVKTPKGVGPFWDLGFEKAVTNVTAAWKSLYAGLSYGLVVAEVVKNWNLDTGEDMDNPGVFTFW